MIQHRFMIGQYGGFDDIKFARDFRRGFYGIEACLLASQEDVDKLHDAATLHSFTVGVHFPLRSGRSDMRDALFLAQDKLVREQAYAYAQSELDEIVPLKPAYVLFHYPKPVLLDERVDWTSWRFPDRREFAYASEYTLDELVQLSEELFAWLSARGEEYGFTPVLEFDALEPRLYEGGLIESLLDKYPRVRLCLDTGRLYLQECVDPYFQARDVLTRFAKYAEVIHLWTLRYTGQVEYYHWPVLPEQNPDDGWAPIADYLRIIARHNEGAHIQFEHRSDQISDEEMDRCYHWVEHLLLPAGHE
ncbi:sugar phosphate isomerase/epimerase [Paenibacillus filicis]|uniref:Sugar phosphate isomerase/epimerase n=1 Tax=Paenibacillus filicis TaxID=669464 RepID=A0ABU9DMH9_9BACL